MKNRVAIWLCTVCTVCTQYDRLSQQQLRVFFVKAWEIIRWLAG